MLDIGQPKYKTIQDLPDADLGKVGFPPEVHHARWPPVCSVLRSGIQTESEICELQAVDQ